ncbi:hypothetical protein NL676_018032 [Syzygium grande]|nr:hypothetical protein NL676_018032 [Syzygium grande]
MHKIRRYSSRCSIRSRIWHFSPAQLTLRCVLTFFFDLLHLQSLAVPGLPRRLIFSRALDEICAMPVGVNGGGKRFPNGSCRGDRGFVLEVHSTSAYDNDATRA